MAESNKHINCTASARLLADSQLAALCNRNFQIAQWFVEPMANQLRYQGTQTAQPQSLEPRVMFLLCVLAANAGNVVSRNDLMTALWPKVVVNENSLTRAVSELRKALEIPANPSEGTALIDTIPKRGYRLNALVKFSLPVVSTAGFVSGPAASASTVHPFRYQLRFALAASVAVISALLIWQLPTGFDGRPEMVAISAVAGGAVSRADDTGANVVKTGNEHINQAVHPAQSVLSGNGDLFAYVSYNDAGSSLTLGSLTSFSSPVDIYETEELIFNLQWSPVDNILMFAQTPRFSPAALSPDQKAVRLVMFDVSTMSATVLSGYKSGPALQEPFNLT